jgi:hypothetical protein
MSMAKNIIKRIMQQSLSPASYQRALKLYGILIHGLSNAKYQYSSVGYQNRRRLRKLHNAYMGQRCFIIGSGPSLAQTDLCRLEGEITIGSNALFLMFDKMGYHPTFYTVEDNLVAEDRAEQINHIKRTTKIFPRELAYCLLPDSNTIYINFLYKNFKEFPKFTERFDKVVYWGGTVTYLNIQLAYYIGCREIYLIGIDHNYEVPSSVDPLAEEEIIINSSSIDVNHFHPDYFGPGYRWHNPRVDRMEKAYMAAKNFAVRHNMKIYNATIGGKLEIFPRISYESLFKSPNPPNRYIA